MSRPKTVVTRARALTASLTFGVAALGGIVVSVRSAPCPDVAQTARSKWGMVASARPLATLAGRAEYDHEPREARLGPSLPLHGAKVRTDVMRRRPYRFGVRYWEDGWPATIEGDWHQMGTTRMSDDPGAAWSTPTAEYRESRTCSSSDGRTYEPHTDDHRAHVEARRPPARKARDLRTSLV